VVNVSRRGGRFVVIFRQRERAITAAPGFELRPVINLDRRQRAGGGIETEQAVTVDRVTAVLLVDPAVVEKDALAIGIVNDLVPPLRGEPPLFAGAGELPRLVLDLDEGVRG
jgi:hypothetical protein